MSRKEEYSEAFIIEVLALIYEKKNIMQVARKLGIPYSLLYKWTKNYPEAEIKRKGTDENNVSN